jgi:hypothetical protein
VVCNLALIAACERRRRKEKLMVVVAVVNGHMENIGKDFSEESLSRKMAIKSTN